MTPPQILLALCLVFTLCFGQAQSYTLNTNLTFTNTIYGTNTHTYAGTNCFDVTRYKTLAIVAVGSGTNNSTNTISFTFKTSADNTNYDNAPAYTLTGTANGVTRYNFWTNLTVGDGVGYVKPYQVISSVTNTVTNAWVWGAVKTFPRN